MTTTNVYTNEGTQVIWASGTTPALTFAPTGSGIGGGLGRMGEVYDWGTNFPSRCRADLTVEFDSAPTAGGGVELYWATADNYVGITYPGGVDGTDDNYRGSIGTSEVDEFKKQLQLVGVLIVTNDAAVQTQKFVFDPVGRSGCPVVVNEASVPLSNDNTNQRLVVSPLWDIGITS